MPGEGAAWVQWQQQGSRGGSSSSSGASRVREGPGAAPLSGARGCTAAILLAAVAESRLYWFIAFI